MRNLEEKNNELSLWAEEVANKVKDNECINVPLIMAEVCKEFVRTKDMEKAKVIVAGRLING